ncbi:MAG TPA: hypothetical protein VNO32_42485 [Candidatus Acidoferrum sp.]|nr:hypothetical protein [Candidatus Acidoferrum sp.]
MPKSSSAFGTAVLLSGLLWMQPSFCAAQGGDAVVKEGPDAEVQEFRLADLEVRLRTMQAGAERAYFAGVLANRTGDVAQSIHIAEQCSPQCSGIASGPGRIGG